MKIKSFKGHVFEDYGLEVYVPWSQGRAQWAILNDTIERAGTTSTFGVSSVSPRNIIGYALYDGPGNFNDGLEDMKRLLNPLDTTPGELVIVANDDVTELVCMAKVSQPAGYTQDNEVDVIAVAWIATDPRLFALTPESETGVLTPVEITNPTFAANTTGWTQSTRPSGVTASFSRSAGTFFDAAGSGQVAVTANSGAGGTWYVMNDDEYPCSEGAIVTVRGAMRSTVGNASNVLTVYPVLRFYDASDALLQTNDADTVEFPGSYPANTWVRWMTKGEDWGTPAPANTAYCTIGVKITAGAGTTGTVNFDAFEFVSPPPGVATPFNVAGNAPTNLTITATPSGNFPQAIYSRAFTITNNRPDPLVRHALWIDLGNNSAGLTRGTYAILLRDGKPQPCEVTDYDAVQAYLWMVIDYLAPGETATYTLLVSDQTVLPGQAHVFNSLTAPAFDTGHVYATTTSGSSSTVTNIPAGLGTEIGRWIGATMHVLSGAQAGAVRELTASTATSVTHAALSGGALASGVSVAIFMSSNSRWVYPVRKTERQAGTQAARKRGLWWLSSGQTKPEDYREDVPGAWHLALYYDNNDVKAQKWNTPFDPGGGADYFALLDANRRWEGSKPYKDGDGYDGVEINLPVPITEVKLDYQFQNPNGMATFVVGSRKPGGAVAYNHDFTDSGAHATLTDHSIQTITLQDDAQTVYMGLIPGNGQDEIGAGWKGDNGSATSAGATTLTDSSKEWVADQFIGGTIEITRGTGAGAKVAITDNTSTVITVASWPNGTPDSTSAYVIRNKNYSATVRNHTYLHLELDSSGIVIGALGAETPAFVLYRDIILSEETAPAVFTERQRVAISPEVTGRYIVLTGTESLVVDGVMQRAYIADSGDEVRIVPPLAYSVLAVDDDGSTRLTGDWLQVSPGDWTITLASDEPGVTSTIDVEYREAVYG